MSIQTFDSALDFMPEAAPATNRAGKIGTHRKGSLLEDTLAMFGSLRTGLNAARHYEAMTNRGVVPNKAVREIFQSHFAGK